MPLHHKIAVTIFGVLLSGSIAQGGKGTPLRLALVDSGKAVVDESFSGAKLDENWSANKGVWSIEEGAVVGREKKEDMHAAVLTLKRPHRNSEIQFSFKLDGAIGFHLSFNHAKGHLFRVAISESGLTLTKDKNKKDPKSKPQALAKAASKFESGQWHTLLVETQGDKVTVQSDTGAKLTVQDPSLYIDKTGYRFVVRGEALLLDDLKIWNAEP